MDLSTPSNVDVLVDFLVGITNRSTSIETIDGIGVHLLMSPDCYTYVFVHKGDAFFAVM